MRTYLLPVAVIAMALAACHSAPTKEDKAREIVKEIIQSKLKDPQSYESVSFSKLEKLKDTVLVVNGQSYPQSYNGEYEIAHTYRSRNDYGGIITKSDVFHLDSALTGGQGGFIGHRVKPQQ